MITRSERINHFISFGTAYRLNVPRVAIPVTKLGYAVVGANLLARIGAPMTCRDPAAQAVIYAMLRAVDIDAVVRIGRHVCRYDLIANGQAFDGPILMIRGALDKAVNRALGPTLAAMEDQPNFELMDLPDAGHCANLDQPEKVREIIIAFLNR
jgi:pimeloyl-ACP methyl ester carboxylesterase